MCLGGECQNICHDSKLKKLISYLEALRTETFAFLKRTNWARQFGKAKLWIYSHHNMLSESLRVTQLESTFLTIFMIIILWLARWTVDIISRTVSKSIVYRNNTTNKEDEKRLEFSFLFFYDTVHQPSSALCDNTFNGTLRAQSTDLIKISSSSNPVTEFQFDCYHLGATLQPLGTAKLRS